MRHPVLVLAGRFDRACPVEVAEQMTTLLPNACLQVFEDSAHMSFVEQPEDYLPAARAFLRGAGD